MTARAEGPPVMRNRNDIRHRLLAVVLTAWRERQEQEARQLVAGEREKMSNNRGPEWESPSWRNAMRDSGRMPRSYGPLTPTTDTPCTCGRMTRDAERCPCGACPICCINNCRPTMGGTSDCGHCDARVLDDYERRGVLLEDEERER